MYRDNGGIIGSLLTTTASSISAGNKSATDLKALFESLISIGTASGVWDIRALYSKVKNSVWPSAVANAITQSGGTMTLNSVSLGSYDYTFYSSSQTVSSYSNADYFTTTEDSRSALIYINGDLTINSGQTFIPSNRKLFTALYINGNLTNNGTISMTGRGANHSGTGSNISAGAIRIATGTFDGVTDPNVPSSGGAGASANMSGGGVTGSAGSSGGTGGGGSGANNNGGSAAGSGSAGTSFTGGSGGGEHNGGGGTPTSADSNGGKGGNGAGNASHSGGTGNGGGTDGGGGGTNYNGNSGTGGVLMIFVKGTLSGTGTVVANGVNNIGGAGSAGGGASGGGSATLIYTTDSSTVTITANGGTVGGSGGAGTARKLSGL